MLVRVDDLRALGAELAAALADALAARDPEGLRRFLAPGVRWGDEGTPRACVGPDDVIATMRDALGRGAEARIDGVAAGERGVMASITVAFPDEGEWPLYQVYDVADGLVTRIRAFGDVDDAWAAAGVREGA
jgi:SnoaL-like domain